MKSMILRHKTDGTRALLVWGEDYLNDGNYTIMDENGCFTSINMIVEDWETLETSDSLMKLIETFGELVK